MLNGRIARTVVPMVCLAAICAGGFTAVATDEPTPTIARLWNEQTLNAIRLDTPKPTVHARNLFHVSVAMWDAWAAYEPLAYGYFVTEKHTAADVALARAEAISYAAFRILEYRYVWGPGETESQAAFRAQMVDLGYDPDFTSTEGNSPAALGNRIAAAVIEHGRDDGANEGLYMQYYDNSGYFPVNEEMIFEFPGTDMVDPNRWQPLAFDHLVLQNGIVIGRSIQEFINPNWGQVTPFALTEEDLAFEWVYLDPGLPPQLGGAGDEQFKANAVEVIRFNSWVDPADPATIDISPGAMGNSTLGTNDGTGRPLNPFTGQPYAPNGVKRGDFGRVMAEFWADGPDSETPPGHWNTLAHWVMDYPGFEKRIGGTGPVLDDLEYEVKLYLALNGAVHDAAVAAWGIKGYYDYSRPISHIRHMAGLGQSSEPSGPDYHPDGIPLVPGLIESITSQSAAPGERHEHLSEFVGEIATYSWVGGPDDPETEVGGVRWIRALTWMPYQRATFVTPAFAGYISGHSTFSRAAAEVMAAMTGTEYFPGGMASFVAEQDVYLQFESGPSETIELQWATYFDAADQAGISRLWGGIHPRADDLPGRIIGSGIGLEAWAKAQGYYLNRSPEVTCLSPVAEADDTCRASTDCDALAACVDPEGEPVTMSCSASGSFGLGLNQVEITCGDGASITTVSCGFRVDDVTEPVITATLSPDSLWPPNHRMIDVEAQVVATDNCGTPALILESVTSSEVDNGEGDGNTVHDVQGIDEGTPDYGFKLRSERAGAGPGRIYTAIYRATDASGNSVAGAAHTVVPHDQGGCTDPIEVLLSEGPQGTNVAWQDVPGAVSYSIVRGRLGNVSETSVVIDLGTVSCIEAGSTDTSNTGNEDAGVPQAGEVFFYAVEYFDGTRSSYGSESAGKPRAAGAGDCQ